MNPIVDRHGVLACMMWVRVHYCMTQEVSVAKGFWEMFWVCLGEDDVMSEWLCVCVCVCLFCTCVCVSVFVLYLYMCVCFFGFVFCERVCVSACECIWFCVCFSVCLFLYTFVYVYLCVVPVYVSVFFLFFFLSVCASLVVNVSAFVCVSLYVWSCIPPCMCICASLYSSCVSLCVWMHARFRVYVCLWSIRTCMRDRLSGRSPSIVFTRIYGKRICNDAAIAVNDTFLVFSPSVLVLQDIAFVYLPVHVRWLHSFLFIYCTTNSNKNN